MERLLPVQKALFGRGEGRRLASPSMTPAETAAKDSVGLVFLFQMGGKGHEPQMKGDSG